MRIGIFTDTYEPYVSGVTTSIKMLYETLLKMGHEVFMVTANLNNHKFIYDEARKIIYIPGIKTGIYDARLTSVYSIRAMKIIKSWNLDVIHSHTEFGIGTFSRFVRKQLNIPLVHTYHTLYEDYVYYITKGHFKRSSQKIVKFLTVLYGDKTIEELIVPTEKTKLLFTDKYSITRNINVIPTGIDTDKFMLNNQIQKEIKKTKDKLKIKDTDFVIGAVGRIAQEKSFDVLINYMKNLLENGTDYKLLIIGDGPARQELEKLSKTIGVSKNVIFTGKVRWDLMPSYYNIMDVIATASKTETQGLTVIEGLAASKPAICIDDPSFYSTVVNNYNGILFHNESEYIKNIINLKNSVNDYKTMSLNAKNSIYKYSKEVYASEVLKVYVQAIEDKKKVN